MTRVSSLLILLALLGAAPAAAQDAVVVRTSVDRTAMWVGDRVTFTVELRCAPRVDVLTDDLAKDRVRVEGGEILDAVSEELEDGLLRRVRYTVTSYRVDVPDVRIEPFTVRYYSSRTMEAATQVAPSGEITVPGVRVPIRSTLPDGPRLPAWREPSGLRETPAYIRYARPVGLALMLVAVVPVVLMAANVVGHARRLWDRRHVVRSRRQHRTSFAQVRALEPATDAERVRAYEQLDGVVRDHLHLATGVNARALTPQEVRRALDGRRGAPNGEEVESLLMLCERARYAPEPPPPDGWREAVRRAEAVLGRVRG